MKNNLAVGAVLLVGVVLGVLTYNHTHSPMYKCMHSEQADAVRVSPEAAQLAAMVGLNVEQLLERACTQLIAMQPEAF